MDLTIYRITPGGDPDDLAANAVEITPEELAALPLSEQSEILLTSVEMYLPMVGGAVTRRDLNGLVETALKGIASRAAATCEAQAASWDKEWEQTRSESVRRLATGARRAGEAIASSIS